MNCKKGDLAMVTSSPHPENIGRIVEVICLSSSGDEKVFSDGKTYHLFDDNPNGPVWFVFCPTPLKRIRICDGEAVFCCEAWIDDSRLCPITPPSLELTTQDDRVRNAYLPTKSEA